ncbi:MAG TPA: ATP-binding cassette domain-containing protein [Acidimicrobiales bacterium]|nr:ATP-binding cassette domain-containing protein [Acidimicrobiales bacterium]
MSPEVVFEVTGLSVNFGGVAAVSDVSFTLDKGQILGIIGPNGAGKTTVFDAISGFVNARGRVTLAGRDISGLSPQRRSRARLGRSFQDARLFPSLTVFETLAVAFERHNRAADPVSTALRLPWVARSERRIKARVEDLIELMGLGAFRDKFIAELSTGSRRIVDLAVIMAHDPLVLLLDEPSSGIAQRETEALGPLLLRIREETGASLLVIEHDMPLLRTISNEILALETGQVLTRGTPDEVLEDPRVVAAYLGTNQAVVERSGRRSSSGGTRPATRASAPRRPTSPKPPAEGRQGAGSRSAAKATGTAAAAKRTPAKSAGGRTSAKEASSPKRKPKASGTTDEVLIDLTGGEPVVRPSRTSRTSRSTGAKGTASTGSAPSGTGSGSGRRRSDSARDEAKAGSAKPKSPAKKSATAKTQAARSSGSRTTNGTGASRAKASTSSRS